MPVDIKNKSIVIYGFGAQGRVHTLNLRDSGCNVAVCLPEGSRSIADVKAAGLKLFTNPAAAARKADIAVFLAPDSVHEKIYDDIETALAPGSAICFAHGLNIHYEIVKPRKDLDVVLAAPLAHADEVRRLYINKSPLSVMTAVYQNATESAWEIVKTYVLTLGATEKSMIKTTFAEETETDLFAEQVLICGGISQLITTAFETLVENSYSPEIAYHCCLKEAKIMTEMFARHGIHGTFERISDTARFGALSRGPRVIGEHVKKEMQRVLDDIKSGKFVRELTDGKTDEAMKKLAGSKLEEMHKALLFELVENNTRFSTSLED